MIAINRVLPTEEYLAASRVANLHSTLSRRIKYFAFMRVLPAVAAIIIPLAVWLAITTWQEPGDHAAAFALQVALATYGLALLYCPLSFQSRAMKLYRRNGLDRQWLIEVSPEGVHSAIVGQGESRLEWGYFDSCAETGDLFVLIRNATGMFVSLPKSSLSTEEQQEFRSTVTAHVPITKA